MKVIIKKFKYLVKGGSIFTIVNSGSPKINYKDRPTNGCWDVVSRIKTNKSAHLEGSFINTEYIDPKFYSNSKFLVPQDLYKLHNYVKSSEELIIALEDKVMENNGGEELSFFTVAARLTDTISHINKYENDFGKTQSACSFMIKISDELLKRIESSEYEDILIKKNLEKNREQLNYYKEALEECTVFPYRKSFIIASLFLISGFIGYKYIKFSSINSYGTNNSSIGSNSSISVETASPASGPIKSSTSFEISNPLGFNVKYDRVVNYNPDGIVKVLLDFLKTISWF